jgi:transcriptional regulator with XRE-family HTH domain
VKNVPRDAPRVRELRLRKGWTQDELAEHSGIWRNTISEVESGKRKALPRTLQKLAEALGEPIEALAPPPSGLEAFLAAQAQGLRNIRDTAALIGELVGTAEDWEVSPPGQRELRASYLRKVVDLLIESTERARLAAVETLAIEAGHPKEAATEDEPATNPDPAEADKLETLLRRLEKAL